MRFRALSSGSALYAPKRFLKLSVLQIKNGCRQVFSAMQMRCKTQAAQGIKLNSSV
jgi:hypothetical protein